MDTWTSYQIHKELSFFNRKKKKNIMLNLEFILLKKMKYCVSNYSYLN